MERNKTTSIIAHNLKIAYRNLVKYRLQTVVCIMGLAIGMTGFALSAIWTHYLASSDNFHPDKDRIFLLSTNKHAFKSDRREYLSQDFFLEYLPKNYAEVESVCSFAASRCSNGTGENHPYKIFADDGGSLPADVNTIDSAFCRFFQVKLLEGTLEQRTSSEILITPSLAKRLFGDKEALGQEITLGDNMDTDLSQANQYRVVGIVEEWPESSYFHFDILINNRFKIFDLWWSSAFMTFVKLHPGADAAAFGSKVNQASPEWGEQKFPRSLENVKFLPIHRLKTDFPPMNQRFEARYTYYFMVLSGIIIFCALCNYLVSMITRIRIRCREMALRRTLGGSRRTIIHLFNCETLIMILCSALIGLLLTLVVLPEFRYYSEVALPLSSILTEVGCYLLAVAAVGIAASSLTTYILTRRSILAGLQPVTANRSNLGINKVGTFIQLTVSLVCIFYVSVMQLQLKRLMYSDALGMDKTDVGLISCYKPLNEEIKQAIKSSALTEDVLEGNTSPIPMRSSIKTILELEENKTQEIGESQVLSRIMVDSHFYDFFHIRALRGRLPKAGTTEAVVSLSACKANGWEQPIGKHLQIYGETQEITIVGIVPNLYQESVAEEPEPQLFYDGKSSPFHRDPDFIFRAHKGCIQSLIEEINQKAAHLESFEQPDIINLEKTYNEQFSADLLLLQLQKIAAIVSILISLIGVFSTICLTLEQRRREIAIRKIHGGKFRNILQMFLFGQLRILLLSAVVAGPIGYILSHQWMSQYDQKITLYGWLYPVIIVLMAVLIFVTVYRQISLAARENPAQAIKQE